MRVCHEVTEVFHDPNLVSCAGLAPVLGLAERAGLSFLVAAHVKIDKPGGVNAPLEIGSLVAGMVAGADSIQDMLRHGAMRRLFTGVRAPSTLGTFLRTLTFGHVRQPDAVASRLLIDLAGRAPLLPGAGELAYLDVDDTLKQTYGYAKQGASRGYTGVKGLNALLAVVSTPSSAPVIAAARLRKGGANSARGADRFVSDALITAKNAGATGTLVLRADSAYYSRDVIAAALRQGACFSITARQDKAVRKAISMIDGHAWTTIKYTNAIFDEQQQRCISDAQVAEIDYTAFTSKPKAKQITGRLIVRRVKDMNPANQSELFTAYRSPHQSISPSVHQSISPSVHQSISPTAVARALLPASATARVGRGTPRSAATVPPDRVNPKLGSATSLVVTYRYGTKEAAVTTVIPRNATDGREESHGTGSAVEDAAA